MLRRLPYPYRAILAICSDLDETPDRTVYWDTARYLNTTQITSMGPGLGLEVGNTIYFDMPPNQFAYWNTDDVGREMVRALIRSGHVDCLHSFGDLADTRAHAARALEELVRHDCRLQTWIDHAVAPTNFGSDIMRGSGDVPEAAAYHADLSVAYGIRFVWRGRVTSVIGQDVPRTLRGILDPRHPVASSVTAAKELAKGFIGRKAGGRYEMHVANNLLHSCSLRDGQQVDEFLRSNPHWGGVSCEDTADGLPNVLNDRLMRTLVDREAACILYTHLGKIRNRSEPFGSHARSALNRLAELYRQGTILVTTTRRLLTYSQTLRDLTLVTNSFNGVATINARLPQSLSESEATDAMSGVTFYVSDPQRTQLLVNGREIALQSNAADSTGQRSVRVPWRRLEFPCL